MAICASGSQRKATTPKLIHFDPTSIAGLFPLTLSWIGPFLPFIPPFDLDMDDFCALEPVDAPTILPQELLDLITWTRLGPPLEISFKLTQLAHQYIWYQYCECITGTTPAAPAGPSEPADLPILAPASPSATSGGAPCATMPFVGQTSSSGASQIALSQQHVVLDPGPFNATLSYVRVGGRATLQAGPFSDLRIHCYLYRDDFPARIRHQTDYRVAIDPAGPFSQYYSFDIVCPADIKAIRVDWEIADWLGGTMGHDGAAEVWCEGSTPGQLAAKPSVSDAYDRGLLEQILQAVTLVQRQVAPFSYIELETHAGLTGNGSIDTQGIIAYAVQLTTIPPQLGHLLGMPTHIFDAGYTSAGTADGWQASKRIDAESRFYAPDVGGAITRIGYSLQPGVVATIKTFRREF